MSGVHFLNLIMLCTGIPGKYLLISSSSQRKIITISMRAPITKFPHLLPLCFPMGWPCVPACTRPGVLPFSWACECTVNAPGQGQPSSCILDLTSLPFKAIIPVISSFFHLINFPFYWIISISMHICCFFHLKGRKPFYLTSSFSYYPIGLYIEQLPIFSSILLFPLFCDPFPDRPLPLPLHKYCIVLVTFAMPSVLLNPGTVFAHPT